MPHRSRLSILLLDLPPDQHAVGSLFWAEATGRTAQPQPDDPDWAVLGRFAEGFHLEVQRTGEGTPARWHLDIEADDIEAEVTRLEGLGAKRLRFVESSEQGGWWQMTDPVGLVFCVVGVQHPDEFDRFAVSWP
ncbi:VOC family protein [Blastococcus sp. SYSU D00820]